MSTRTNVQNREEVPKSLVIQDTSASSPVLNDVHNSEENDEDNRSVSSSRGNNPSILSQPPDRFGFLVGSDQYTDER